MAVRLGGRRRRPGSSDALSVLVVSLVGEVWGAQRRLLDLAPRLAAQGVVLTLAAPGTGDMTTAWGALGLPWRRLDLPDHTGLRRDAGARPGPRELAAEAVVVGRSAWTVARLAREADLVQSHTLFSHLDVALAGRLARRPALLDLHDLVAPGVGRRVLGLATRLATATIANSRATASTVGEGRTDVHVVHPGVDVARFHPGPADPAVRAQLTADPTVPLVGILGRVDPRKGVDDVVRAVAGLPPPWSSTCLVVIGREYVGSPEFAAGVRQEAGSLLGPRARFLGPRGDVPDVLRALDVVVNASHHEPFGRTVLEAQACGVPVVATAAGGIPEFVADGETGLLVPPREPAALARALTAVLGDGALRRRLSEAGRRQAEVRFGLDAQSAAVAAVYRLVVGERTSSARDRPTPEPAGAAGTMAAPDDVDQ